MEFALQDLKVGKWLVEPSRLRVSSGDQIRPLDPKPMAVLIALADAHGQVVTRDELFREVWGDAVVVDGALTRCISELRRVFDDSDRDAVIETVRGVGYRLIPRVDLVGPPALPGIVHGTTAVWFSRPALRSTPARIAVIAGAAIIGGSLLTVLAFSFGGQRVAPQRNLATHTLTVQPGVEAEGRISPDGRQFVYLAPGRAHSRSLYIGAVPDGVSSTETSATSATSPTPEATSLIGPLKGIAGPAWSPNSESIGYMVKDKGTCEIRIYRIATNAEHRVGDCGVNYHSDLAWSGDGAWLAYSDRAPGGALGIVLLSTDGITRRFITDPSDTKFGDHYPSFSRDGSKVAFVRTQFEDAADVFVVGIEGGAPRRVTNDRRTVTGVAWQNDKLIFSSKRSGPFQLWTAAAFGNRMQQPTWLPLGAAEAHAPSVTSDGSAMIFQSDLSVINVKMWSSHDPASIHPLASSPRLDASPALSPTGDFVAFVSSRGGTREVWKQHVDGSGLEQLTEIGGGFVDSPVWSGDGRFIVFSASIDANADLYSVDISSRHITRLTTDDRDDVLPRFIGDSLSFASDRSGEWQVWTIPFGRDRPAKEEPSLVTTGAGLTIRSDPDTDTLYVAGPHEPGIRLLNADGSAGDLVVAELHELDWGAWDVVRGGILFVSRAGNHPSLKYFSFASGGSSIVATLGDGEIWSVPWGRTVLDAADDGKTVVFSRFDQAESELVLVSSAK